MARLLSTADVAAHLGIHHRSVSRLVRSGLLPATKIGSSWAVREEDVEALARYYHGKRGRPPGRAAGGWSPGGGA